MSRPPRNQTAATPRTIRFTDEEWERIKARAAVAGVKPGEWVRGRALEDR